MTHLEMLQRLARLTDPLAWGEVKVKAIPHGGVIIEVEGYTKSHRRGLGIHRWTTRIIPPGLVREMEAHTDKGDLLVRAILAQLAEEIASWG